MTNYKRKNWDMMENIFLSYKKIYTKDKSAKEKG